MTELYLNAEDKKEDVNPPPPATHTHTDVHAHPEAIHLQYNDIYIQYTYMKMETCSR